MTQDAFEHFLGVMLAELEAEAPFDGIYLALHGAMAVRGVPRPEAEIARRVRAIVGPVVPIAATFDPHGNEDAEFLHHADLAFAVTSALEADGYEVETAGTGPDGVRLAAERRPDLIILDVMLPGFDGFRVLRMLRDGGAGPAARVQPRPRRREANAAGTRGRTRPNGPRGLTRT